MMAAVARGCLCLFVLLSVRSGGMLRRLDDYYVNWQKNADEPYPSTVRVANDTAHTHTHIERWIPHDAHMCRKKNNGAIGCAFWVARAGVVPSIFANERVHSNDGTSYARPIYIL